MQSLVKGWFGFRRGDQSQASLKAHLRSHYLRPCSNSNALLLSPPPKNYSNLITIWNLALNVLCCYIVDAW